MVETKTSQLKVEPGALVTPRNQNSIIAHWVGVVTRMHSTDSSLCYVLWPQRADLKDEMSHCQKATELELVGEVDEYRPLEAGGEKRHLYSPTMHNDFPWFHTRHYGYLTYKEYLKVLQMLKEKDD